MIFVKNSPILQVVLKQKPCITPIGLHWWKNRLPSSPISREAVGTATNGTFSRGSGGEPRPKAWAQGARWPAGAREGL